MANGYFIESLFYNSTDGLLTDGQGRAVPGLSGAATLAYTASSRALVLSPGNSITLPLFTSTEAGLVPLSGGGTSNFLRADGTWASAGGGAGLSDGDKGDVVVSASAAVWTIDAGVVTLAKMADLAQDQFIGRTSASTGVPQSATITSAARTVLDDTTVAAMIDTLGGTAAQGTGAIVRANGPTLTAPTLGAATGTSLILSTPLAMASGGFGVAFTDPNADRIPFWDDSAGNFVWLVPGSGISITGTTITAAAGSRVVESVTTGSPYTLLTGDDNKIKHLVDAAAQTVNITTAFNGLSVTLMWLAGAGTVTIDANAGVNLNGLGDAVNVVLSAAAGAVDIVPTGSNTWNVIGALGDLVATDITDSTAAGRTLLTAADAAAQRTALAVVGKMFVPVMAAGITPSASGGCAALATIASAANQPDIQSLDFDTTTQEYAQFSIAMPESWDEGTLTAAFVWSHAATATNFGVVWNIQAVACSDDDAIAVAFGTAQQIADTGGTTNDVYLTSETPAITVSGTPANKDTVFFRVSRVTADGSDTMAIDARLHGVRLYYTANAANDA